MPEETEEAKAKRERKEMEANLTPAQRAALDADRDQRTVFVYQLSVKATEENVFTLFETAGKVRDVRLITDRNTRKSKGFGYIEFYERESIPRAIALSGTVMRGVPVMVKFSEAEKNLAAQQANAQAANVGPMRLYVGNLHPSTTEADLRGLFSPFGDLEAVQIHLESDGSSAGFGFVTYCSADDANMALGQLNGFEVAGMSIKVGMVNDPTEGGGANDSILHGDDTLLGAQGRAQLMARLQSSTSMGGNPMAATSSNAIPLGNPMAPASQAPPSDGLNHDPGVPIAPMPQASILLRNMFDPTTETDPNFDQEIKEDVGEECNRYGSVVHIAVGKNTPGFVYVMFADSAGATNAKNTLAGRWFAGKMISVDYVIEAAYKSKFGL